MKGDRILTMLLEVKNGVLEETLTVTEEDTGPVKKPIPPKKTHKRLSKQSFREAMKDPSKFPQHEVADPDHPTIVLRENPGGGVHDEVSFYHFEAFSIAFGPHPDVIEDTANLTDGPFTNSASTVVKFEAAADTGGPAGPMKFVAGPYKVATGAKNQAFWKFTVLTASGLKLDPCIIIDP